MVRQILEQFSECFAIHETFTGENFFNSRRGVWMFYPHKGNVRVAADTWRRFAALWTEHRAALNDWCTTYLDAHRPEIFARYYIERGAAALLAAFDRRAAIECEDIICGASLWTAAKQAVEAAIARLPIECCDDPTILAIHEGRQCEHNGYFCWHCDDMEAQWTRRIQDELKATQNPFLNVTAGRAFYRDYNGPVPLTWVPPKPTREPIRFDAANGKTAFQAMKSFIEKTATIRATLKFGGAVTSDYKLLLALWSSFDLVDSNLQAASEHVARIEELL